MFFLKKAKPKVLPKVSMCSGGHEWRGARLSWKELGLESRPFCLSCIIGFLERESGTKLEDQDIKSETT